MRIRKMEQDYFKSTLAEFSEEIGKGEDAKSTFIDKEEWVSGVINKVFLKIVEHRAKEFHWELTEKENKQDFIYVKYRRLELV